MVYSLMCPIRDLALGMQSGTNHGAARRAKISLQSNLAASLDPGIEVLNAK